MLNVTPKLNKRVEFTGKRQAKKTEVALDQKSDCAKANAKETLKHMGLGFMIASAIFAATFLVTKGRTCLLEFNAKKAQEYAKGIQQKAQKLQEEVSNLFKNNGMKDEKEVAKIVKEADDKQIMQEFAADGVSLIRKAIFKNEALQRIEVLTKKGVDVYEFVDNKLALYAKDYKADNKGIESYKKGLEFANGKLENYTRNYKKDENGAFSFSKELRFRSDRLTAYIKNHQENALVGNREFPDCRTGKKLIFENGELAMYTKGYVSEGPDMTYDREISFYKGRIQYIMPPHKKDANGSYLPQKTIFFEKNQPIQNLVKYIKSLIIRK